MRVGGGIWSCVGNDWGVYGKGEEHEIVGVVEWKFNGHWALGESDGGKSGIGSRKSGVLGVCAVSDKRATVSGKGG
jgi:hypothetical protein